MWIALVIASLAVTSLSVIMMIGLGINHLSRRPQRLIPVRETFSPPVAFFRPRRLKVFPINCVHDDPPSSVSIGFGERPGVNRPHTDAWVVVLFITFLSSAVAWPLAAQARDNGQLPAVPNNVRTWYKGLTQPDNPKTSCCGEADAFEADSFEVVGDHYVAIITNGRGDFPTGARILVPNNKMKWDSGNPTGHGIIFIGSDAHVLCYVTPGGI